MSGADGSVDGAADGASNADAPSSEVPFAPGEHEALPVFENSGGPILAHVELSVVTFADEPNRASIEAYARWIVGSSWLRTVGAEYGVGAGTFRNAVRLPQNAPSEANDNDAQTLLAGLVTAGMLPAPNANSLALLYYPQHTMFSTEFTRGVVERACESYFGYHQMVHRSGINLAYGVIPSCRVQLEGLTEVEQQQYYVSHELIEAATDADPLRREAWAMPNPNAWTAASGNEVGDLCVLQTDVVRENGFVATPVWSNQAALLPASDPCIPAAPNAVYYHTSATPSEPQFVDAGSSVTFQLRGWSTAPVAPWSIAVRARGAFEPQMQLSTNTMTNGGTATLTVSIPSGTPSRASTVVFLYSLRERPAYRTWPIYLEVN